MSLAYSPERVKSQLVMRYLSQNSKVIGGFDEQSAAAAASFYKTYLKAPVIDVGPLGGRVHEARRYGVPGCQHSSCEPVGYLRRGCRL